MNITDGKIALRALESSDVDILYRWENDPQLWHLGDRKAPLSRAVIADYIATYDADPFRASQLRLMVVLVEDSTPIGAVDLFNVSMANMRAEVGILIAEPFRRRGYGVGALKLLAAYSAEHLALHQLWCTVGADNEPSRAVFAAAGFTICGHMKSWIKSGARFTDAYLYQLLLPNI